MCPFLVYGQVVSSTNAVYAFPEEASRSEWDKGCPDWPLDLRAEGAEIISSSQSAANAPEIVTKKAEQFFRVFIKSTVRPEKKETQEQLLKTIETMLDTPKDYPQWVLPGINDSPDGGIYFVTVDALDVEERANPARHFLFTGPFSFQLLWMKMKGFSTLYGRKDVVQPPDCPVFKGQKPLPRFLYRMIPRAGLLDLMMVEVFLLPKLAPSKDVEIRMRIAAKPDSKVYMLMPEKLVVSQLNQRSRRLFENFVDFRRLGAVPKASKVKQK